ncbi:MAG: hypothetical protein ACRDNK_24440 [Solirubrobacteraceae bacterium]
MRTFAPWAVLALRGRWGRGRVRAAILILGAGELAADKHAAVPARTAAPALAGRLLSGAVLGLTQAGPFGAALGAVSAVGAVGAAVISQRARASAGQAAGIPEPLLGVAEDVLVMAIATLATRTAPVLPPAPGDDEPASREA